jgi:hypothetical protein
MPLRLNPAAVGVLDRDVIAHLAYVLQVSLDQVIAECLSEPGSAMESEIETAGVAMVGA